MYIDLRRSKRFLTPFIVMLLLVLTACSGISAEDIVEQADTSSELSAANYAADAQAEFAAAFAADFAADAATDFAANLAADAAADFAAGFAADFAADAGAVDVDDVDLPATQHACTGALSRSATRGEPDTVRRYLREQEDQVAQHFQHPVEARARARNVQ